jgi:hypothetical protein
MSGISAFALFCEDIRREGAAKDTLLGVMGSTMRVPSFPGIIRKLAIYVQLRFAVDQDYPNPIFIDLEIPGENLEREEYAPLPTEILSTALERAKSGGHPFATIISRIRPSEPLPISGPTTISVILKVGDDAQTIGFLKIAKSTSPSASPQPSEQSPPAAQAT